MYLRRCRIYHTLILWVSLSTVATCVMIRISPFSFSTRKQLLNWIIHFCLFIVCLKFLFTFYHGTVNHHETTIWGILCIHPPYWTPLKKIKPPPTRHFWCRKEEDAMRWVPQAETGGWDSSLWGMFKIPPFPGNKICVSCSAVFCFPKGSFFAVFVVFRNS